MHRRLVFLTVITTASLLAGCASPASDTPNTSLTASHDSAQAKRMLNQGTAVIKGSALIRQAGGGVVTCAGRQVFVMAGESPRSREWAATLFGEQDRGYIPHPGGPVRFDPKDALFADIKATTCDAQGAFKFDGISSGRFIVFTRVTWVVAGQTQGGTIMRSVTVADGAPQADVVLAP